MARLKAKMKSIPASEARKPATPQLLRMAGAHMGSDMPRAVEKRQAEKDMRVGSVSVNGTQYTDEELAQIAKAAERGCAAGRRLAAQFAKANLALRESAAKLAKQKPRGRGKRKRGLQDWGYHNG